MKEGIHRFLSSGIWMNLLFNTVKYNCVKYLTIRYNGMMSDRDYKLYKKYKAKYKSIQRGGSQCRPLMRTEPGDSAAGDTAAGDADADAAVATVWWKLWAVY